MKRIFLKTLVAASAMAAMLGSFSPLAQAQDKGLVAVSMPTN